MNRENKIDLNEVKDITEEENVSQPTLERLLINEENPVNTSGEQNSDRGDEQEHSNSSEEPNSDDFIDPIRANILKSLKEIQNGFGRVMMLYEVLFWFGIAMIIIPITLYVVNKIDIFSLGIFAGIGFLDLVSLILFKPLNDLQASRIKLARTVTIYVAWLNDSHNLNLLLESKPEISVDDYEKLSSAHINNIVKLMNLQDETSQTKKQ